MLLCPDGFNVFEDPVRGRGLRNDSRSYAQYEKVLVAEPSLLVVRHDVSPWYCQACFKYTKEAAKCSLCSKACYCSEGCLKAHYPMHGLECALWCEEPEFPHYSLIQMARALAMIKVDPKFKETIDALVSYEDPSGESWDADSEAGLIHWIASMRAYAPDMIPLGFSDSDMRRVYFSIKLNGFNVKPGEGSRAHASGLFPSLALFNHSCDPNCGIQYVSGTTQIKLVALRSIEVGEELTIAYTNPFTRSSERRAKLKRNFFFNCACSTCALIPAGGFPEDPILSFALSDSNPISDRIVALKALNRCEENATIEAGVSILDSAMKLRGQNSLELKDIPSLLDIFVDDLGRLQGVKSASPDVHWQWIVFFTDAARRSGDIGKAKSLAKHGLSVVQALFPDSPPSILPYESFFASILKN